MFKACHYMVPWYYIHQTDDISPHDFIKDQSHDIACHIDLNVDYRLLAFKALKSCQRDLAISNSWRYFWGIFIDLNM